MKSLPPPFDPKALKRIVIKIGSNVLTNEEGLNRAFFKRLAKDVNTLIQHNIAPIIVSSGAIATAMSLLAKPTRPATIPENQAYAAIGQPALMALYAHYFNKYGLTVAQVLLTQDGLDHRERFLNAKHALNTLIENRVVPIVNENDTVTIDEIKIGDNDQLSAHVAHLVNADLLLILSHVDGLYNANPATNANAKLIPVVHTIDQQIEDMVFSEKNHKSVGGMATKLKAARIATSFGIPMIISSGFCSKVIPLLLNGKIPGTLFTPPQKGLNARKHWIGKVQKPRGTLVVDAGAQQALIKGKKSLLATGICGMKGDFDIGDCVEIRNTRNKLIGKGLASYPSRDIDRIKGLRSSEIEQVLGYKAGDAVIHRDDLVII